METCRQRPWGRLFLRLCVVTLPLLLTDPLFAPAAGDDPASLGRAREEMVRTQIRGRQVADPATLRAMATVPRHLFVPDRLVGKK